MSHYLFSVSHDYSKPLFPEGTDLAPMVDAVDAFNSEIIASGQMIYAGGLAEPNTATTVSVKEGETLTTDGPFAEARERIGGFWVIDVANLDEALALAAKASAACGNPVEVRPFQDA
jgi:hypothetical protein